MIFVLFVYYYRVRISTFSIFKVEFYFGTTPPPYKKRRGCVHPLRPPSSNHCEEVLSFFDKAANLRLFLLWQRAGNITVHDRQVLYSFWLRFHSTPRDSAGPKVLPSFTIPTTIRCRIYRS